MSEVACRLLQVLGVLGTRSDASAIDVLMACGVRGDELESVPRAQGDL